MTLKKIGTVPETTTLRKVGTVDSEGSQFTEPQQTEQKVYVEDRDTTLAFPIETEIRDVEFAVREGVYFEKKTADKEYVLTSQDFLQAETPETKGRALSPEEEESIRFADVKGESETAAFDMITGEPPKISRISALLGGFIPPDKQTQDDLKALYPGASLIGKIGQLGILSLMTGGIAPATTAYLETTPVTLYPKLIPFIANALQRSATWGMGGIVDVIAKEPSAESITHPLSEAAFGAMTGGIHGIENTSARVLAGGIARGGWSAGKSLLKDGNLDKGDLTDVAVNVALGAAFELINAPVVSRRYKEARMTLLNRIKDKLAEEKGNFPLRESLKILNQYEAAMKQPAIVMMTNKVPLNLNKYSKTIQEKFVDTITKSIKDGKTTEEALAVGVDFLISVAPPDLTDIVFSDEVIKKAKDTLSEEERTAPDSKVEPSEIDKTAKVKAEQDQLKVVSEEAVEGKAMFHSTTNKAGIEKSGFSIDETAASTKPVGVWFTTEKQTGFGDDVIEAVIPDNLYKVSPTKMDKLKTKARAEFPDMAVGNAITKYLQKEGYDGLDMEGTIVVFDPAQIKTKAQVPAKPKAPTTEPATISELKKITEKINEYTAQGKTVPDSLIKRQKALTLEVKGKAGKPVPVKKILGIDVSPKITLRETTLLKNRIRDMARGAREGAAFTKKQIKEVQGALINMIEPLEAKDKAKFIKTIRNIQDPQKLEDMAAELAERIRRVHTQTEKAKMGASIKKELTKTKPVKSGQRRVGKFDPDTNKFFETLRGYNKLNQAQAQVELEKLPEEPTSEIDLIKKRMLSLKANGMASSVEIFNAVLKDIKRMKVLGAAAKDDAHFDRLVERQEKVDDALAGIDKVTGNKDNIVGRIVNLYRKGFSNIYSMINSIMGKSQAEKYDPEIAENKRNTKIFFKTKEMSKATERIYKEKNVLKLFGAMAVTDYSITDVEGLTTELGKLDLIDIYNTIKNSKKLEDYNTSYGEDQVTALMGQLTTQDKEFGDMLQETVQGYREVLNQRNIETTGLDLGFIENYWPATSEHTENVYDDLRVQGETPSALKQRAKGKVIPVPANSWNKALKHIAQAEHVANLSRKHEELKRMFTDRKVKHAIKQKFGEGVYTALLQQIDGISLNAQVAKIDAVSKLFGTAINNWVTSKIALNPSTYVRQLMSVGNYMDAMPADKWTKGFLKGIRSPVKTFNFMWNNAPFLEGRFHKGYSEALQSAIEGAEKLNRHWSSWTNFLSSLARSGDITAIVYGGFPMVEHLMSKEGGGLSRDEAMKKFESATLKAQQSGLTSSISLFQQSKNPFSRLFLAFKNTVNQYLRKNVDAMISYHNGDIDSAQLAKTLTIYMIIQPILYVLAGFAIKKGFGVVGKLARKEHIDFEEMGEELLNDIMIQIATSPVNAIPLVDGAAKFALRKLTGQKAWKAFSLPLIDDLQKAAQTAGKEEKTAGDYLSIMGSVLEVTTAAPVNSFLRYYGYIVGDKEKPKPIFDD